MKQPKYQRAPESRALAERAKQFWAEYLELSKKYDIELASCGCCSGTQMYDGATGESVTFVFDAKGREIELDLPS
jgi:hypothetical protein